MREKAAKRRRHICAGGITPAYAGKRVRCSQQALPRTDHPRMCGEKVSSTSPMKCLKGSPPHVRGKAGTWSRSSMARGITPAYAGKSRCHTLRFSRWWDHPRMCGEKHAHAAVRARCLGSPPHVRGKVRFVGHKHQDCRITPACAGKSQIRQHRAE